jgi:predicted acyl esterase
MVQLPEKEDRVIKTEVFEGEEFEMYYKQARTPVPPGEMDSTNGMAMLGFGIVGRFNQRTYAANDHIICEQDVPVKMRDGVTIYVDVFRPRDCSEKVPAIVAWSFFGKRPSEGLKQWQIMGVKPGVLSEMTKFESPDPSYWCRNGYAIINPDPRGVGHSEGDIRCIANNEGEDCYDLIEWLADQWWCNGKVGMSGNSNVAMIQWRTAQHKPPHLTCIAPMEGSADVFSELFYEGGIPSLGFNASIFVDLAGPGLVEDVILNAEAHPFRDVYWESKNPRFEQIDVPAYVTACWQHFHLLGSTSGFRRIKSRHKWLRVHREFEWPDQYTPSNIEDLKMFFDRYLKGIHNGWEMTPRVRLEVMDVGEFNHTDGYRGEDRWPLKRTEYKKLHINAPDCSMLDDPVSEEGKISYDAETGLVEFDYVCPEDMEITGYMKLRLWVEADGHDDMDLFIHVKKASTTGEELPMKTLGLDHPGAWGKLRVSVRELDPDKSTDYQPVLKQLKAEKLSSGEVVPVDIPITPHSRFWHKGQHIRVQISGHYIRGDWFEPFSWETDNKGSHVIYSGGRYDSYLQVPVIPPRFQDGSIIIR